MNIVKIIPNILLLTLHRIIIGDIFILVQTILRQENLISKLSVKKALIKDNKLIEKNYWYFDNFRYTNLNLCKI